MYIMYVCVCICIGDKTSNICVFSFLTVLFACHWYYTLNRSWEHVGMSGEPVTMSWNHVPISSHTLTIFSETINVPIETYSMVLETFTDLGNINNVLEACQHVLGNS
jgi:hypothetical protein